MTNCRFEENSAALGASSESHKKVIAHIRLFGYECAWPTFPKSQDACFRVELWQLRKTGASCSDDHAGANCSSPKNAAAQSEGNERGRLFLQRDGRHRRNLSARLRPRARSGRIQCRADRYRSGSAWQYSATAGTDGFAEAEVVSAVCRDGRFHSGMQHAGADGHGADATRSGMGCICTCDVVLGGWTFHRPCMEYMGGTSCSAKNP